MSHVAEPVKDVSSAQVGRGRLSDRPVDLPIEVPDDERRLHNDARRFARLLVSVQYITSIFPLVNLSISA